MGLTVVGARCLDVGASTGGFTDCLLQRGAASVCAVDVGHGQLHPKIAANPRVASLEGINARNMTAGTLKDAALTVIGKSVGEKAQVENIASAPFDLVVIDVSFISLTLVLPSIWPLVGKNGSLLCLVKPQFEAGLTAAGRAAVRRGKGKNTPPTCPSESLRIVCNVNYCFTDSANHQRVALILPCGAGLGVITDHAVRKECLNRVASMAETRLLNEQTPSAKIVKKLSTGAQLLPPNTGIEPVPSRSLVKDSFLSGPTGLLEGAEVRGFIESPIAGSDGNVEWLLVLGRSV